MSVQTKFAFKKINYLIMILGIALILLGFVMMSLDQETYGFGFLGLTLGPIIVFSGFLIQFVAILYKSKKATN
jgi:uncharacterized membrane protein